MKTILLKDCLSIEDQKSIEKCACWKWDIPNEQLVWRYYLGNSIAYAKKGNILFYVRTKESAKQAEYQEYPIRADKDGWYLLDSQFDDTNELKDVFNKWVFDNCKFSFVNSIEEWEDEYLSLKDYFYTIEEDPFEDIKILKWWVQWGKSKIPVSTINGIGIEANQLGYYLILSWSPNYRKKADMGPGDEFVFLFDDKTKLSFVSKDNPTKLSGNRVIANDKDYANVEQYCYRFPLDESMLNLLTSKEIIAKRIIFANGDAPATQNFADEEFRAFLRIFLRKSVQLYEQLGYKADKEISETSLTKSEKCFVYLMLDESNGYYKIGISNNPTYRERTLQSEKPTIKLICSKEYPSRIIAEAIENALHNAFKLKHLRGEWFNLNSRDILDITQTLR